MFKFGFSDNGLKQGGKFEEENESESKKIEWAISSQVHIDLEDINIKYSPTEYNEIKCSSNVTLKLVKPDKIAEKLKIKNVMTIVEAESHHSDLITAKYEGGLKLWECTYDLANYLLQQNYVMNNKAVLDLGCGAGMIGILCLTKGAVVHFQDYNDEVIRFATIPNIILNLGSGVIDNKRTRFYSGDWKSFVTLLSKNSNNENGKYDFICTSETIYNSDNHRKLYEVFKQKLKIGGLGFIAGKTYYFGVGGSMRQFEDLVINDGIFKVQVAWKSNEGLQREILVLSHLKKQ